MVFNDVLGPQRRSLPRYCNALRRLARMSETIDGANLAAVGCWANAKGARRKPEMRRKSPRIARGRRNSLMTLSELPLEEDHAAALLHDAFYLALAEHKITAILKTSAMHLARC